eukprot:CAMPEP_0119119860 /NCGR_PEP_ID=MMETSP1310-20130426/1167_1 /TAXON_ID=464262 /ORGANISM="Genus nov. species nov., Strain RCC2339" /LENGTH=122 /DNA_ID=CAMNT_0007109315 /DNA_START=49 /DNA_END=413 /DNA_ORIENTATION=+
MSRRCPLCGCGAARLQRPLLPTAGSSLHRDALSMRLLVLLVVQGAPEEHDVRLRPVDGVVHPAPGLLHAQRAPLGLRQQPPFRHELGDVLRQHHMPVLVGVVVVLLAVLDRHRAAVPPPGPP